jgi:DNA-binding NtrC family response regulator
VKTRIQILVVEDREIHQRQMTWALRGDDRDITVASSVEEALGKIGQVHFDVIVTDLWLGGSEANKTIGLQVLDAALAQDSDRPVIVITAYGNPETGPKCLGRGAFDYIERGAPGEPALEQLKRAVTDALGAYVSRRDDE